MWLPLVNHGNAYQVLNTNFRPKVISKSFSATSITVSTKQLNVGVSFSGCLNTSVLVLLRTVCKILLDQLVRRHSENKQLDTCTTRNEVRRSVDNTVWQFILYTEQN
jgi:hypothetical protein